MEELYEPLNEADKLDVEIYKHEYIVKSNILDMLQKKRIEKNISLEQISFEINIPLQTLIDLESDVYFNLELIIKVLDYLGYELYPTFKIIER